MTEKLAFQDDVYFKGNHCWGCGNENPDGLNIKSYWDGNESVCTWKPEDFHTAGWPHALYGGIISGIIDCHCMCTIIAEYYKNKNTEEKESHKYWFATGSMKVDFLKPTPVNKPFQPPNFPGKCSGKSPIFMSKEFTFDKTRRYGCTVDLDHGAILASTYTMHRPDNQFFAGPGFA